jgi:hypothetical protein
LAGLPAPAAETEGRLRLELLDAVVAALRVDMLVARGETSRAGRFQRR